MKELNSIVLTFTNFIIVCLHYMYIVIRTHTVLSERCKDSIFSPQKYGLMKDVPPVHITEIRW